MWKKLNAFISVAEQAGFAKAAKKLNISKATITRYIQELEAEYQSKLFNRTTRHLSLTEQGETFYHYALEILQINKEAQEKISQATETVSGHIKIGLPFSILNQFAQEKVALLANTYPELSIEIIHGNHITDLLSSHFDLALHCGPLPDLSFYYEEITTWQKMLCASPNYLKESGKPKHPDELSKHRCLDHADNHTLCWSLRINNKLTSIPITSQIKINSSTILKQLSLQGLGIAYLPSFTIQEEIDNRNLIPLLKKFWPEPLSIYARYPSRRKTNKKVGLIIETLHRLFQ